MTASHPRRLGGRLTAPRRHLARSVVAILGFAVLAAWAPAAQAADFCVAPNTTCGGSHVATFEAALGAADDDFGADRVFLGTATYTAPTATGFFYDAQSSPVEIIGAGMGQTVLTGQIGGQSDVLFVQAGPGSSIHDLTIRLPQNAASGLSGLNTASLVQRIEVLEAASQANVRHGVELFGGGALEDAIVTLGTATSSTAVLLASPDAALRDSTVEARSAVTASRGGRIERSVLRGAGTALGVAGNATTVTDSLLVTSEHSSAAVAAHTQTGGDTTVNLDGVTLIGSGQNASVGVYASNELASAQTVTVNLADTVLRGFDSSLARRTSTRATPTTTPPTTSTRGPARSSPPTSPTSATPAS
jgi:hypothetical protein